MGLIFKTDFYEIEDDIPKDGKIMYEESVRKIDHEDSKTRLLEFSLVQSDNFLPPGPIIFLQGVEFHMAMNMALTTFEGVGSLHCSNSFSTQRRRSSPRLKI